MRLCLQPETEFLAVDVAETDGYAFIVVVEAEADWNALISSGREGKAVTRSCESSKLEFEVLRRKLEVTENGLVFEYRCPAGTKFHWRPQSFHHLLINPSNSNTKGKERATTTRDRLAYWYQKRRRCDAGTTVLQYIMYSESLQAPMTGSNPD